MRVVSPLQEAQFRRAVLQLLAVARRAVEHLRRVVAKRAQEHLRRVVAKRVQEHRTPAVP